MRRNRFLAAAAILNLVYALTGCHRDRIADGPSPVSAAPVSGDGGAFPALGAVHRDDPRLDTLVPPTARIEKLVEGLEWAEGPVWMKEGDYLLFSDVPRNVIFRWEEGERVRVFLQRSGSSGPPRAGGQPGSNGLGVDPVTGSLVICEHGNRRVSRLERTGARTVLADRYEGKRLNSPNDLVFRSSGDLYFTDPPYGLPGRNEDPARELDFNGVYRLARDGQLTLLTRELTFPNGIALSPDEKTLYVANSDPKRAIWMAYDVREDGSIANGRVFFDATPWAGKKKGLPDGLKVDKFGNVFATGPGGVHVFTPAGERLGAIDPGEATANCAWGEDGTVLYLAADMYLCRIRLNTRGLGF